MRHFALALLLVALGGATVLAKQRHCAVRFHLQANARDSEIFATQMRSQFSGKPEVIEKTARISEQDVAAFYPYPANDGSFGVLLQLDEHGKLALDTLSVERRGTPLFVFVNGRPLTELQIDRRISDGRIFIPAGLNAADIELMRKDWRMIGSRKK
ncbi:MAG: hypothetical protein M3Z64_02520 [Verrucomicrobiota bacterium]|nr:hypothetical protein [Verrucomicrobiota bacterium]